MLQQYLSVNIWQLLHEEQKIAIITTLFYGLICFFSNVFWVFYREGPALNHNSYPNLTH